MGRKPREYDDDDGRTIVSMDIDGMRWHDKRVRREKRAARRATQGDQLTKSEARRFTWYSLLAAGLIGLVFSLTWVLFILFCIYVWFR